MSAAHTPGPWYAHDASGDGEWGVYFEVDTSAINLTICHVSNRSSWHDADGYGEANARLIAAAPDLLQAAKDLKEVCNRPSAARTRAYAWKALDKAIAKAEGR